MIETPIRILVVEDSEDDRDLYATYLRQKRFQVITASDGREGLEKALQIRPQVIILDMWLPKVSGWDVMQRLKGDEGTKNIPIIVVSGHLMVHPLGVAASFAKPVRPDVLGAEINSILAAHGLLQALRPALPLAGPLPEDA